MTPPARVQLFTTCVADLAVPGPAAAAVEVLEAVDVEVAVPRAQSCCGQPALTSGFPREAAQVARGWLDAFEDADAVVTVSGSCAAMIHHHLPRILDGADAERAAGLAQRTFELSQFLVGHDLVPPLRLEARVAYHDACHMLRSLGERNTPRALLSRIDGLELRELADPEICCGFGGTFATRFPEVSVAMADDKLAQAETADVDWLVSADAGCLLHVQGRADCTGRPVRTRHIAQLVHDALPAAARTSGRSTSAGGPR